MCWSTPKIPKPVPAAQRKDAAVEADDARRRLAFRKGSETTIRTTPLGDPNYGKAVAKPTVTGV